MNLKNISVSLAVAILYYTFGVLGFKLLLANKIVSVGMFVPEGIALAFALFFGKRALFGIFAGQFALAYVNIGSLYPSLAISTINTLEALIGIYLFYKLKLSKEMDSFRDIVYLFGIVFFVLQPFSAVLSNSFLYVFDQINKDEMLYLTFSWWFGNVMGQFLVTPFLLLFFTNYKDINIREYLAYGVVFFIYLYFLELVFEIKNPFMLLSLSLGFIIFVIIKKNIIYATFLTVVASFVSAYSVYSGIGTFSFERLNDNLINYNLYVLSLIVIVWLVGILFGDKKRYESQLENKIAEVIEQNKEQQLFLLQQNRLAQMGELISMIAHQWRQPLNNLSLINQVLVSKFNKSKLDDEVMEYFKINSKKQIDLMSNTIDDFRDFFKAKDEKSWFLLNGVLFDAIDMVSPVLKKNLIEVEFEADEDYKIFGYENSFAQVVLNLLNNSKDALLEKDTEYKKIIIQIKKLSKKVEITIEDNGIGIDETVVDKVFDPYFSTKKDKNGTGLGLYMSKMIIEEQMDGELRVSAKEDGAKFVIVMNTMEVES